MDRVQQDARLVRTGYVSFMMRSKNHATTDNWPDQELIGTKFRLPPLPGNLVDRRRLLAPLDRLFARKLTTISAPAGFGKTTLLLQWVRHLQQTGHRVAWLALDADDNELRRFLCYLIAALQAVDGQIGQSALALLRSSPVLPSEAVLASLINDLEQSRTPLVVMLDDTHWLQAADLLQAFESLLTYAPAHIHFILAGRGTLPLAAARLKVHGQMLDLQAADLRFDLTESGDFLNSRRALGLSPADLVVLQHRTEGWAAGLQLASLSLDRRVERSAFIKSFSGSDRDVAEFLVNDVFIRQPRAVQDFMLRTAFPDRLNASLCAALTDLPLAEAAELLAAVERAGLFLIPLDSDGRWFRYHHLFGDFLRHQLERLTPEEMVPLHLKAAAWLEAAGDTSAAINHLLAAGASDRAADKVEACAMELISQSHVMLLSSWLHKLPADLTMTRPRLLLTQVWLFFHMNRPLEAVRVLRVARRAIAGQRDKVDAAQHALWQAELRTLMAGVMSASDRSGHARAMTEKWAGQLPDDQPFLHGVMMNIRSYCESSLGHLAAARLASAAARKSHVRAQSVFGIVYADLLAGLTEKAAGNLRQSAQLFARAQGIADEALGAGSYAAALVGIFQAELHYEWNDLDQASHLLNLHHEVVGDSALVVHEVVSKLLTARLEAAQGRIDAALAQLDRVEHHQATAIRRTRLSVAVMHERVRLMLLRGDTSSARLALQSLDLDPDDRAGSSMPLPMPTSDLDILAIARLLSAEGAQDRAIDLLQRLAQRLDQEGRGRRLLQTRLLLALCHQRQGDLAAASAVMAPHLRQVAQQNVIRSLLDEGPEVATLIANLRQRWLDGQAYTNQVSSGAALTPAESQSIERHLDKLLVLLVPVAPVLPNHTAGQTKLGPKLGLSAREIDVLRLLSDGLSNRDLSRSLAISPDTVKWHLKNIFGKLGVESRAQAIVTAQRLRLIETSQQ
jgi:LuxR family maltose regulon positive regulatory protein